MKKNEQAVIISGLVADLKKVRWAWWLCTCFLFFGIWLIFLGAGTLNNVDWQNLGGQITAGINIVIGTIGTLITSLYWGQIIIKGRKIRQLIVYHQKQPIDEEVT